MPESTSFLHAYLRTVLALHRLESVTVFLPQEPQRPLVHVGDGLAPPELSTVPLAVDYAERHEAESHGQIVSSHEEDCRLVLLGSTAADGERRRARDASLKLLIGFRLMDGTEMPSGDVEQAGQHWLQLFEQIGILARATQSLSQIVNDSVTGLPGRVAFQTELEIGLEKCRADETPISLLLLSPARFELINDQFGRAVGDRLMQRIASKFAASLRADDPAAKYGGAILAAVLRGSDASGAQAVAHKVTSTVSKEPYEEIGGNLTFHAGTVTYDPRDGDAVVALDLLRRAERALAAARVEQQPIVSWHGDLEDNQRDALQRLDGYFTGDMTRDYRSMRLLAESVSLVATCGDSETLASKTVELLVNTLPLERAALIDWNDETDQTLAWAKRGEGALPDIRELRLSPRAQQILSEARSTREIAVAEIDGGRSHEIAIPLLVGPRSVGSLFIEARPELVDATDISLLRPLTTQLAVALDRVRLEETDRRIKQMEVDRLRKAVQQTQLLFRSPAMTNLVGLIRRVAPTDATVLVIGESGTGKELISRTVHQLSRRVEKPLIVVDCAAIPPTLIESELFGHERGAYTGAQARRIGRLEEADGGTVLLDEIGELPLEVQSKLLRFVQEKQLTRVGSTLSRSVDARVIAATNRDLGEEVAAGRFREDLYYRLNVVKLDVPPLRERQEDVQLLSESFLETYNRLYEKRLTLSAEAAHDLNRYSWPGNVRELQNKLQQAVILSEGTEIRPETIGLTFEAEPDATQDPEAEHATSDPSTALGRILDQMVTQIARSERPAAPLGKWLTEDLILEADRRSQGIATRAARRLGMADTTFRRQRDRILGNNAVGLVARTDGWSQVAKLIERLVADPPSAALPEHLQSLLLQSIAEHLPETPRTGAAVLGVSMPTYRQRLASLSARKNSVP
ncbi:MAG: sigma 54-interacting transcriptional regulator [Acidobacteriota bacterium]